MTSTATSTTTRVITAISTRATTASPRRAPRKGPPAAWGARAIVLLVAAATFLFGGTYLLSLLVPAVLCALLVAAYRPWTYVPESRALDWWLLLVAAAIALQLVPLPDVIVDRVSPAARGLWQAVSLEPVRGSLPLSVDLSATVWAAGVYLGVGAVFFVARQVFAAGGVRIVARGIASIGLILSAVCLAQDATAHGAMYWRWKPLFETAPPFGPFVNRNHYATWVVLAVPLVFGYLLAHETAHTRHPGPLARWRVAILHALDARSIWLAASICLMLVGLVASLSRGGMAGVSAALALAMWLRGRRMETPAPRWALAALGLAAIAAIIRIDPTELFQRFSSAGAAAADRVSIWRATLPVVRDFWLTGTGAGTFETVMLAYQRTPSLFRINAAHNQYLQIVAEGGLLVTIPVIGTLVVFTRASMLALSRDRSGMYLIRAGALSGLVGVAVQSLWETGLTTPANAVVAAVLAAIVLHRANHPVRGAD